MKKKFSIVISLAVLFSIFYSCEQEDQINSFKSDEHSISVDKNSNLQLQFRSLSNEEVMEKSCGDPIQKDLLAGQTIGVGEVLISNSETHLFVTYNLTGNWWLSESHLFAGNIEDASFTKSGNPQIGKFPYHGQHDLTQHYTFTIPLEDLDDPISIIAHAVVVKRENGQITETETAFGEGITEFIGNRWGWIISYKLQSCDNEDDDGSGDDEEGEDEEDNDGSEDEEEGEEDEGEGEEDFVENDYDGCMDAFAYANDQSSLCFLNDFDSWGWTNEVGFNDEYYNPGDGFTYTYPLYASAYECAVDNSILIGEVSIKVYGGDAFLNADINISLSKEELSITDVDIFVDETPYPLDDFGNPTIVFDKFNISLEGMNEKKFDAVGLDWFFQTNFIVHVKVCPEEILE